MLGRPGSELRNLRCPGQNHFHYSSSPCCYPAAPASPSNDRPWQRDVAILPSAEIEGEVITLRNARNFTYRSESDYTPHWYDKTVDLPNDNNTTMGARPRESDRWKLRHTFSEFGMNLPLATLLRIFVAAGVLVASALSLVAGGDSEDGGLNDLTGTTWHWQRTLMNDDTLFAPDDPSRYTLRFHSDATVSARVDCNQMGGIYKRDGASITIELTHGTRAMCPPDSLDIEFQREISEARQMVFADGALHFDLAGHRGTMTFIH